MTVKEKIPDAWKIAGIILLLIGGLYGFNSALDSRFEKQAIEIQDLQTEKANIKEDVKEIKSDVHEIKGDLKKYFNSHK